MDALKLPGYVIIVAIVLTFVLYGIADENTGASDAGNQDATPEKSPIIGWREGDAGEPND